MDFTRRDLGKLALIAAPLSRAFGAKKIDSKFGGVQIGAITYSFNRIAARIRKPSSRPMSRSDWAKPN